MDENNFIENNTIRYQFIIVLFFLSFVIFNEKTFQFMKKQTSFTKNKLSPVPSVINPSVPNNTAQLFLPLNFDASIFAI